MKKTIVPSLVESVGNVWKNLQAEYTKNGLFYVASPLSSTPLPIYQWIIEHANEFEHWEKVRFVLMDELIEKHNDHYEYISSYDPASYERFAKEKLLTPLHQKVFAFRDEVFWKQAGI